MKKKIIFLDIDGTLTNPGENNPPESAVKSVKEARKQGHRVFMCTGRNYGMLSPLLKYGFDGFVASSGGYIECMGKVIYDCPLTEKQRRLAVEALDKEGVYKTVECRENAYIDEGLGEFLRSNPDEGNNSEMLRWREQIEESLHILPMREYKGQPVYKIGVISLSIERLKEPKKRLESEFDFYIQDADVEGFVNGEVVNRAFDKGKAIQKVCGYLKIPICNSVAVGDSMNDKEMLETAGVGICMENGSERLKKIADDICPSVLENGIREAFLKYHII